MKYEIIKGSEKDFEGAPDWATVLIEHNTGGTVFAESLSAGSKRTGFYSEEPFIIVQTIEYSIIAERRPISEPVWDGEGLPPVGTKCECDSAGDWQECTVILSVDNAIVWQWDWQKPNNACISYAHCAPNFRPIRSPEDVARDEAISEMVGIYFNHGIPEKPNREDYESMAALYDAGYRKME